MNDATTPTTSKYLANAEVRDGCWGWTGAVDGKGYGAIKAHHNGASSLVKAHRVSYELHIGPIPPGMFIDHVCHTRTCTNPGHLRLATNKQNQENRAGANRNSVSGVRGVSWNTERKKWVGVVSHNGKTYRVGRFNSVADAERAVTSKRIELFTHSSMDTPSANPG